MKRLQLDSKIKLVPLAPCAQRGQRDNTVTVSVAVRATSSMQREGLTSAFDFLLKVTFKFGVWPGVTLALASSIDEVLESVQSHLPRQNLLKEQACIVLSCC